MRESGRGYAVRETCQDDIRVSKILPEGQAFVKNKIKFNGCWRFSQTLIVQMGFPDMETAPQMLW